MRALALTALLAAIGALTGEGPATGRVWAQPSLEITFASTNAVQLRFTAKANTGYVIACRDSLSEGTWQPLVVLDPVTFDHAVYFTDTVSSSKSTRFYRVQSSGNYGGQKD